MKSTLYSLSIAVSFLFGAATTSYSQGFPTTPINWSTPVGGMEYTGYLAGFIYESYNFNGTGPNTQYWDLEDLNGDGRPDLVVTAQKSGVYTTAFDPSGNPYWMVFLNNGTSFDTSPVNWTLPDGGKLDGGVDHSFPTLTETEYFMFDTGTQIWDLRDMDGDGRPDLVVTAELDGSGYLKTFSPGSSPYWKVYLNTGTGFSTTATNWTIPLGGSISGSTDLGFYRTSSTGAQSFSVGSHNWDLMDMDGDGEPDLVVTAEHMSGGDITSFDPTGSQYWKVYLNTGTGFSGTETNWALPSGGTIDGVEAGFRFTYDNSAGFYDTGSLNWECRDLNGDSRNDLIITSEKFGTGNVSVYDPTGSPYWEVHYNNGSGFDMAPVNFSLPVGGTMIGGTQYGFRFLENSNASSQGDGSLNWALMEMNGDNFPDLVVTGERFGSGNTTVYDPATSPYWKVYINLGTSFGSEMPWTVPSPGFIWGTDIGVYKPSAVNAEVYDVGSRNWFVKDMDGNGSTDIVFASEHMSSGNVTMWDPTGSPYWKVHLNSFVGLHDDPVISFNLYPNPCANQFSINTDLEYSGILIIDQLGRVVAAQERSDYYNVSDLSAGLYFVIAVDENRDPVGKAVKLDIK